MADSKKKKVEKKVPAKKETTKKVVVETKEKKEEKKKGLSKKAKIAIIVSSCLVVCIIIAIFVIRALIISAKYDFKLDKKMTWGELTYDFSSEWKMTELPDDDGNTVAYLYDLPERVENARIQVRRTEVSSIKLPLKEYIFTDDNDFMKGFTSQLGTITYKQQTTLNGEKCWLIDYYIENEYCARLNLFASDNYVYGIAIASYKSKTMDENLLNSYKKFIDTINLDYLVFSNSKYNLKKGESSGEISVKYKNGNTADVTLVSENEAIAKIENNKVVAIGNGECNIKATDKNGVYAKQNVKVTTNTEKVVLDRTEATIHVNESVNVISRVEPADSSYGKLTWSSSDTSVATVSDGSVTGKKVGKTTITAESEDGKQATCEINVIEYTEQEYKDSCTTYSYDELFRNSDSLKGQRTRVKGEVVQVIDGSYVKGYRVNITEKGNYYTYYTDTIYVTYYGDKKILEDDIIEIYGTADGEYTYQTVLGASKTLPKVYAKYIDIVGHSD